MPDTLEKVKLFEQLWIGHGGDPSLATMMAALALATEAETQRWEERSHDA